MMNLNNSPEEIAKMKIVLGVLIQLKRKLKECIVFVMKEKVTRLKLCPEKNPFYVFQIH